MLVTKQLMDPIDFHSIFISMEVNGVHQLVTDILQNIFISYYQWSCTVCLPFSQLLPQLIFFTPSCLHIVDSLFPAWCRSTIFFLVSLDSSLVLAMVEFGAWLFEAVDRWLSYR